VSAEAERDSVVASARREAVAVLSANVAVAEAERDGAYAAWQSALRILAEPQQIDEQVIEAEIQLALAQQQLQLAQASLSQSQSAADGAAFGSLDREVKEREAEAAQWSLAVAQADERATQVALEHWKGVRENPLALTASANLAEGTYCVSAAAVSVAQAMLDDLRAGTQPEELAVAEARTRVVQAQVRLAELQLERLTLRAPVTGTVLDAAVSPGETVLPGVSLATLADLENLTVTVYVPQNRLGDVRLGQEVSVEVDTFGPGRRFPGEVIKVGREPQYTPRNVATKAGRTNTVYAVSIRLPNAEGLLKPGMAADVTFGL
jgi:HlyD family secretion protein